MTLNKKPEPISKRGHDYGVHHFFASHEGSIDQVISTDLNLPVEKVRELLFFGAVYHQQTRNQNQPDFLIKKGDYLRVHTKPRRFPTGQIEPAQQIIFENNEMLVFNKPAGIPVHATVDNIRENVLAVLNQALNYDLKVTHRLDVATQGLIVFAKTPAFQRQFNIYLGEGKVEKHYRALVHDPRQSLSQHAHSQWIHYMQPSPRAPKVVARERQEGWQNCRLKLLEVKPFADDISEVHLVLETGRTHQIRSQMSFEGYPIVGDRQYGSAAQFTGPGESICLQSYRLCFPESHEFELTLGFENQSFDDTPDAK